MTSPNRRNYYRILHLQPDAPDAVIRTAYRTLMQTLRQHPDLGGDGATASLLNEAYATLSDPDRRAAYDAQLGDPEHASPPPPCPPAAPDRQCPYCLSGIAVQSPGTSHRRCQVCGSPLSPPPGAQQFNEARRAFDRRTLAAPVEYFLRQDSGPRAAMLEDFSPAGARMTLDHHLPPHTVLALKTPLFDALAQVVDCQPAPSRKHWQLRVQFLTLALTAPAGSLVTTHV
ncbi:MAG TPA: hypothetical protein DIT63_02430 [Gammaproteobacteria bacterium]|nr:hypothetical protein [Gammaproteobacteria bacterium]